ncbi:hypothetical protein DASC09_055270 [Saccharomycopsis crataegensis]|uniref:Uncharacterized protein n=1 Tax=Saccharomycopsis crataegensis TaxID=43959 RepID=A0AAV5QVP6_9ASCO|nr:hypothetical protein DASC09_055270 [Saccharomycopsis crataegensis]
MKILDHIEDATQLPTPRLNFFTWSTIWRVPTVRLLTNIVNNDENWELDNSDIVYKLLKTSDYSVEKTESQLSGQEFEINNYPEWLILFPEVNIWNKTDLYLQQKQGEKYYLPKLNHLLYPRFKNFNKTIATIRKLKGLNIPHLHSLTIFYYDKLTKHEICPSLIDFVGDLPSNILVRVHIKSRSLKRLPTRSNKLEKWLENEWDSKEKLLESMERSIGHFL